MAIGLELDGPDDRNRIYRPFDEGREYARSLGLKTDTPVHATRFGSHRHQDRSGARAWNTREFRITAYPGVVPPQGSKLTSHTAGASAPDHTASHATLPTDSTDTTDAAPSARSPAQSLSSLAAAAQAACTCGATVPACTGTAPTTPGPDAVLPSRADPQNTPSPSHHASTAPQSKGARTSCIGKASPPTLFPTPCHPTLTPRSKNGPAMPVSGRVPLAQAVRESRTSPTCPPPWGRAWETQQRGR